MSNPTPPPPTEHPGSPHPHSPDPSSLIVKVAKSFGFALDGLAYLFRTQRNARIHLIVATAVVATGTWLRVSRVEWAVLALTIAAILILEGLNTAIEAAVDLACPEKHPLAKAAKDLAAGMVLIGAVASVVVGVLILGPGVLHKLGR